MMQSERNYIHKDNAYDILKAFAKEYRRQNGESIPAEIVIVGGGSIMLNYGFRDFTQDFDIMASSAGELKSIIHIIAQRYNLPDDWMNTDFKNTLSYSEKLREVSTHKYSFNHGTLEFRTVNDEYLIAMKLVAAREYRNDVSDVIGILLYSAENGNRISYEQIIGAIDQLYGESVKIKDELLKQVKIYTLMSIDELRAAYNDMTSEENRTKTDLIDIEEKYPGHIEEKTISDIIAAIHKKKR